MSTKTIVVDTGDLNLSQLLTVAHNPQIKVKLSTEVLEQMTRSWKFVQEIVAAGKPVYGINTGFGALSDKRISLNELEKLQINLIRSHCTGVGNPLSSTIVRAMMYIRVHCLSRGYSGINPALVERLVESLNHNLIPVIPEKGSVGASGDLAPLAHMALTLIGEGEVFFQGERIPTIHALDKLSLKPLSLGPKDGLALINGTSAMLAIGSVALGECKKLAQLADITAALSVDAIKGTDTPFRAEISALKPHPGQVLVANNLTQLLKDSPLRSSHINCSKVQDPYSLRCIPQVHGACRNVIMHVENVIATELNSVTDNPLIFVDKREVLSGGNFHGEALAMAFDYLAIAISELCSISERRVEKMINPHFSELPAFLTKNSGPNSGLMIAHVTHAAITSENKMHCFPCSVDSIPTSTDKEDHVSMGLNSAKKLREILFNLKHGLAIELLCNTQALEFHRPLTTSPALQKIYSSIRQVVPPIDEDRVFAQDIEKIVGLIDSGKLIKDVKEVLGENVI